MRNKSLKYTILVVALILLVPISVTAQTPQEDYETWRNRMKNEYKHYRDDRVKDYQAFREKANAEYAAFMKEAWAGARLKPALEPPIEPEPLQPIIAPKNSHPGRDNIPHDDPEPVVPMAPIPDIPLPDIPNPKPDNPSFKINYYGTEIVLHADKTKRVSLNKTDGETIGQAWEQLADGEFDPLLHDLMELRTDLRLNDWGFVQLVRKAASGYYEKDCNESVLMSCFLLCQCALQCRLARMDNRLLMLMPFDCEVMFNHPYIEMNDVSYFALDMISGEGEVDVFDRVFPNEHIASLHMAQMPLLEEAVVPGRTFSDKDPHRVSCKVSINRNLIDFMNDYPLSPRWDYYALASLSDAAKRQLYPILRREINGKSQEGAVNILMHWVQTAFEYKTDPEQFGVERPLFADESLFYPFCDCEDRSILLSILVRDLLDLDVVLLHFPGHMATAVRFTEKVEGDYLKLEDGVYIICDPTYIGAPVGVAMPQCKEQQVHVILL